MTPVEHPPRPDAQHLMLLKACVGYGILLYHATIIFAFPPQSTGISPLKNITFYYLFYSIAVKISILQTVDNTLIHLFP